MFDVSGDVNVVIHEISNGDTCTFMLYHRYASLCCIPQVSSFFFFWFIVMYDKLVMIINIYHDDAIWMIWW